jgi:hypothetical protein
MKPRNGLRQNIKETAYDQETTNQSAAEATAAGPQTHARLYRVVGDGDQATWTPIAAAWPNKDGMGFSLSCDAIPLQGRFMMRAITVPIVSIRPRFQDSNFSKALRFAQRTEPFHNAQTSEDWLGRPPIS